VLRVERVCKHFHVLIVCCVESASLWIYDMKCKRIKVTHYVYPAHYVDHVLYDCVVRNHSGHRHLHNQWRHHLHLDGVIPVLQPQIQSAGSSNRHIYNNTIVVQYLHLIFISISQTRRLHLNLHWIYTHDGVTRTTFNTHTRHLFILWARVETTDHPDSGNRNTVFHLPVCLLSKNFIVVQSFFNNIFIQQWPRQKLSLTHALSVVWLNI